MNFILIKRTSKAFIFPIIFVIFVFLLILFPESSLKAGQNGFNLWLNIVFPSLLPFFIASELLNGTGFIRTLGIILEPIMRPIFNVPGIGSFPFAMGISSGYPVGAKITADLRDKKLCTKEEAERLLTFTNNSSPLFITGAIATGILGVPKLGILMLLCHIAGSITVGILFRFYRRNSSYPSRINESKNTISGVLADSPQISFGNIGQKLGEAILKSINTLLLICGFIVIFSVITDILINLEIVYFLSLIFKYIFQYLGIAFSLAAPSVCGIFEITTGINQMGTQAAPIVQKVIIAAFILGWGGLSVHAQVASIIARTDISIKPYLFGKLLHGIICAIYTTIALSVSGLLTAYQSIPIFNHMDTAIPTLISYTHTNILMMATVVFITWSGFYLKRSE